MALWRTALSQYCSGTKSTQCTTIDTRDLQYTPLTLSRLGKCLVSILSLAIHISPNNGAIDTVQSGKLVVIVLAMHCALWIIIFGLLLVTIWYHYISGWFVRVSLALKAQAYFGVDYMPYRWNRIIRFCGWWLEFFGTKMYMWAIWYCRFWDCISFFFVHLSTDSFIPGAKGGTSTFSDFSIFCCSFHRFYTNSHKSLYYTIRIKNVWIGTKTTPCTNSYYTICITIVWIRLYEFVRKISEKKLFPGWDFNPGPISHLQSSQCLPSTTPPPQSVAILFIYGTIKKTIQKTRLYKFIRVPYSQSLW